MQAEENSDSEGEEGQAFYAGGSERRYIYVTGQIWFQVNTFLS